MPNPPFDAAQYDEVPFDSEPAPEPTRLPEPTLSEQPVSGQPLSEPRPPRLDLDGEWQRVSPRYVVVEIVGTIIFGLVVCIGAALLWLLADQTWALWVGAAMLLITVLNLIFEPRRVRSIGYQLRADDLLFRRGILFQRFVAVPYGRMQLVDITRGPVARWLGLADLKFVTAAATTAVSIPGLREADAENLRDRLVELAESRRAGL
nr:PH domain-containing protein [Cryobacterium melibiosiphilum]